MVAISVEDWKLQAAFRAGLNANFTFLSDSKRDLIKSLNILDETEGEYAYPARPYTFVLSPDLKVFRAYDGWFFVGRPTLDDLRRDLRQVFENLSNYRYSTYKTLEVAGLRIPQQTWGDTSDPAWVPPQLGPRRGLVRKFDLQTGNGLIIATDEGEGIGEFFFFNFTSIPGEGYRTIEPGTLVAFECVKHKSGLVARNVQRLPPESG
mmetsp:Transcript_27276/g.48205  ORF Transcript_27276/g.48205 Transcript_27276/m.48205 type:complete len:207 (+) Transcript_27276:97-717(+)